MADHIADHMADYNVLPAGDTALVVDFGNRVDLKLSARVLALGRRLDELHLDGIIETVPTSRSLSVYYEPLSISAAALQGHIVDILENLPEVAVTGRRWHIPVCYDCEFGLDLREVAERCNLSMGQVVELHSSVTYHVYMLGFLPGLAYLGDVPEQLALPRRVTPRPRIDAGSLGMGGRMTCVFPMETPCGFHVLGRSPVALWDQRLENGAVLKAGDKVTFRPVSLREYESVRAEGISAATLMQLTH